MKRIVALSLVVPALLFGGPAPSEAGASTDAALALGAFAVFNQLVRGETVLHDVFGARRSVSRQTVVVQQPPTVVVAPPPPTVVYAPPPRVLYAPPPAVVYAPPPPAVVYAPPPRVVHTPSVVYGPPRFVPPGHWKRTHRAYR